jgi:hypothetical protein
LEQHFRALAGNKGYSGGFVEHYLTSLIYPAGLTRDFQLLIALCVITVNLVIYAVIYVKYQRHRRDQ